MMASLPQHLRRALALALLALVLAALGGLVWLPFGMLRGQDAEILQLDGRIVELEARLKQREQLLAERRLLERASLADRTLIEAATPALAGAELQRLLTGLVEAGQGQLDSAQVLEAKDAAPFIEIGVRLSFTGHLDGLRSFLHAVEEHAPVLVVEQLNVSETLRYDSFDRPPTTVLSTLVEVKGWARARASS
jgi:hypothetical protein